MKLSVRVFRRYGVKNPHRTLLLALLLVACAQTSGTARGVVIGVEGSIEEITSFTVLVEGEEITFVPVEGGDYDFPLSHLREHQRTGEPILVTWEIEDGTRLALTLTDG